MFEKKEGMFEKKEGMFEEKEISQKFWLYLKLLLLLQKVLSITKIQYCYGTI